MPLTKKGKKIKRAMEREYGAKKGDRVFYASENAGVLTTGILVGVKKRTPKKRKKR
jgi:hypothetical protein